MYHQCRNYCWYDKRFFLIKNLNNASVDDIIIKPFATDEIEDSNANLVINTDKGYVKLLSLEDLKISIGLNKKNRNYNHTIFFQLSFNLN